jgi:hypothetical protein
MPFLVAHDILDIPRAQLQGLLRASLGPMIVDINEKLGKDINIDPTNMLLAVDMNSSFIQLVANQLLLLSELLVPL